MVKDVGDRIGVCLRVVKIYYMGGCCNPLLCLSMTSNKLTPHTQKFPNQQCQKHPYAPVLCVQSVQEDLHEKSVKAILTVEEPVLNNAYCSGKGSVASKSLFLQNHLTLAQTFRKKRQICQAQKQR